MFGENRDDSVASLRERVARVKDELTTREVRKRKSEERAAQVRKEAQEKAAELADLSAKVEAARLRLQALKGEEVRFRERDYVPFEKAAARVNPRDAVAATQKKLEELQNLLDRNSVQKDLPTFVDVHFNAYVCSFALSRNTTFESLKEEACYHWDVPQKDAVLKNASDNIWRSSVIVQLALAEERRKFGTEPYVRLHLNIETAADATGPGRNNSVSSDGISPRANGKGKRGSTMRTSFEEGEPASSVSTADGDDGAKPTREYIRQKEKEAWQAAVMHISSFFHDAEYATKLDPELEQTLPQSRQRYYRVRMARSCTWILLWATTVGLCIAAMVFRFDTASAFSSALDVYEALGEQPFCVPYGNLSASLDAGSQVLLSGSCSSTEIVRRFGGESQDGSMLPTVPPSERVVSINELSFWFSQVVLPAVGLVPSSPERQVLVSSQTRLLSGLVRISYASVTESLCAGFDTKSKNPSCACYRDYDPKTISKQCEPPFQYSTSTPLAGQAGVLRPVYIGDACTFETDGSDLNTIWLNSSVRVIEVNFNLLSLNLGWVIRVIALVEVGPTRLVVTSITTNVLPLSIYEVYAPKNQALVIVADVFLFLYAFFAVFFFIVRPRILGMTTNVWKSLATVWNLIALLLLVVVLTQIGLGIGYELAISDTINLDPTSVQDLSSQTTAFYAYLGLSTVSLFLLILTVFKHLQSDTVTSNIFQTLHRAARPLGALIFLLAVALASMSVWATLAWGSYISSWTLLQLSVARLGGMIFGAPIDFIQIRETQNTLLWTTFFFLIWVGLVILILVQFLGAIILDAFLEIEAVSMERQRQSSQFFWLRLLFSPRAWLEPASVNKRTKKVSKGFGRYFRRPWTRFKRMIGFA